MSMNTAPSSERIHIVFFGIRNAGKSSLVNAITSQSVSVVSDYAGTTTDTVRKSMELLPLGPVLIIDTPGLDDEGELGRLRVERSYNELKSADLAVLVIDSQKGPGRYDFELMDIFKERNIPFIIAFNKADIAEERAVKPGKSTDSDCKSVSCGSKASVPAIADKEKYNCRQIPVSALTGYNIDALKELMAEAAGSSPAPKYIVNDLIPPHSHILLVIPVDESAPKGRLILPQQLILRELIEAEHTVSCCMETELSDALRLFNSPPRLVITDSQVFEEVNRILPADIPLTSFSILLARYKGNLKLLIEGAHALSKLKGGDRILISEGCTHHRQCRDIGSVKLPSWIESFAGVKPEYSFSSGQEFPEELSDFRLVIHCGGCMLNEREVQSRLNLCREAGVPVVNYGIAIAYMNGILERSTELFRTGI